MQKYTYFDVGNEVTIGASSKYLSVVNVIMKDRTILTFGDDGFISYSFDDVTNVIALSHAMRVSISDQERIVKCLKYAYQENTRIELLEDVKDLNTSLPKGSRGTVQHVDSTGVIHVSWDDEFYYSIAYGIDKVSKIH